MGDARRRKEKAAKEGQPWPPVKPVPPPRPGTGRLSPKALQLLAMTAALKANLR